MTQGIICANTGCLTDLEKANLPALLLCFRGTREPYLRMHTL